ncbi:hypothetical protein VNO80_16027 [Phaseolus coccineus]|uniref:Uncharacterized protein n=1 Tax=Phaseolus coccineus TaxID=3886 RepID=A0AAN9R2T3_PHACN
MLGFLSWLFSKQVKRVLLYGVAVEGIFFLSLLMSCRPNLGVIFPGKRVVALSSHPFTFHAEGLTFDQGHLCLLWFPALYSSPSGFTTSTSLHGWWKTFHSQSVRT